MGYRFAKHYTREEARTLLPQIQKWLQEASRLRDEMVRVAGVLEKLTQPGRDLGGPAVNNWFRARMDIEEVLREFRSREIQIKDLDRGLIDFPAIIAGKEVFLCWEQGEEDIEFWHDLDSGYAGRERI
jgi:hypothetical protein